MKEIKRIATLSEAYDFTMKTSNETIELQKGKRLIKTKVEVIDLISPTGNIVIKITDFIKTMGDTQVIEGYVAYIHDVNSNIITTTGNTKTEITPKIQKHLIEKGIAPLGQIKSKLNYEDLLYFEKIKSANHHSMNLPLMMSFVDNGNKYYEHKDFYLLYSQTNKYFNISVKSGKKFIKLGLFSEIAENKYQLNM